MHYYIFCWRLIAAPYKKSEKWHFACGGPPHAFIFEILSTTCFVLKIRFDQHTWLSLQNSISPAAGCNRLYSSLENWQKNYFVWQGKLHTCLALCWNCFNNPLQNVCKFLHLENFLYKLPPTPPQQKSEGPNLEKFPLAHMKYPICGLDSDPPWTPPVAKNLRPPLLAKFDDPPPVKISLHMYGDR